MKVVVATKSDLNEAVELAYKLHRNIRTRCRPLLIDDTKGKLYDLFNEYIERNEHQLLLVKDENKIIGVTPIYWMEEDKYVSYYQGPYGIKYNDVSDVFLRYICKEFVGYKFYINTAKEHELSIDFYRRNGFKQLEDATLLELKDFRNVTHSSNVFMISKENEKDIFTLIDDYADEDTYWNSERIRNHIDRFIILGYFSNGLQGHIIGRIGGKKSIEIIGFSGNDHVKEDLLTSLIYEVSSRDLLTIDLYTEDEKEIELGLKYKFRIYDTNICFIKYL